MQLTYFNAHIKLGFFLQFSDRYGLDYFFFISILGFLYGTFISYNFDTYNVKEGFI